MIKIRATLITALLLFMGTPAIAEDEAASELLRVTTAPLSSLLFVTEYSAPATVLSLNDSSISAEIQGRAIQIKAEVGEQIKKGALLVELDCRSYINNKKQAAAALNMSKLQRNLAAKQQTRNQRLLKRGVLPRETYDRSESDLLTSKADIELKQTSIESAELTIKKCKIYAPFSGQVTAKHVQQGQIVSPGTPLIQLLQTNKLEVEAELSPSELSKARASNQLSFTTGNLARDVSIRTVIQQLNSVSNTQRVRLSIDTDDDIIAGLNGRLQWKDSARKIPPEYMVRRGDSLGIMLVNDGKVKFHALTSAREGQPAVVGLLGSSQVVVVNRYSVKDGQAVAID